MTFTSVLGIIFIASLLFLVISFISKRKILKVISIMLIIAEVIYFIMFLYWIGNM